MTTEAPQERAGIHVEGLCPLIQVFDMPASVRFYCDALGFELAMRSQPGEAHFDWALLRLGPAALMLNTAYEAPDRPPAPDPARIEAHGDTALYFGCPDVDAAYRSLLARGLDVKPPTIAPYGMKQLYLKDPDGYNLCFQWSADGPAGA